jgi:hypothetical protein
MRKLRNLAVLLLLVLAAMGFNPAIIQAEEAPESPGPSCIWAYGSSSWSGVYSCSWGCDYFYEYNGSSWSLVGQNCVMY